MEQDWQVAFRALLSITPTLVHHPVSATQPQPAFSLIFDENPLTDFVELPQEAVEGGLSYIKILEGVIRGALEMVRLSPKMVLDRFAHYLRSHRFRQAWMPRSSRMY